MSDITRALAVHATSLEYDQFPASVIHKTKQLVLDLVGVALRAAVDADSTPALRSAVLALAAGGEASVWGEGFSLAPAHAALLNGAYAHSLDFDDTHREGSVHPGASVIPAVLALAEQYGLSGKQLITAIVAGYDVTCRLAMALDPRSHYERGFHPTATAGVFGATAACANLVGLSAAELENAFGVNGSQAAGSLQFLDNGAWNKRLHPGLAAHNAILALELARHGFHGASSPIEGRHGLFRAYSDRARPEMAVEGLGERFEVLRTGIKPYPACRFAHSPLDAVIDIVREHDLRTEDVEGVTIGLSDAGMQLVGEPADRKMNPKSVVDGQFSMHFLAAVAIARRKMTWSDYKLLDDPQIAKLMRRIRVVSDDEANREYPRRWVAAVQIRAKGKEFTDRRWQMRGEPESPLDWPEIVAKFENLAMSVVGRENCQRLVAMVTSLDSVPDLREIGDLLKRPAALPA